MLGREANGGMHLENQQAVLTPGRGTIGPAYPGPGAFASESISKQLDESSARLSQLGSELQELSESASRLREEARAFSASLRRSLETNALATRSAWANLQGLATSAGWEGDYGEGDGYGDGDHFHLFHEDHHITLAQLQLEVGNLSKIADDLSRHASWRLEDVPTLRQRCAEVASRAEAIGAQIGAARRGADDMGIRTGKQLDTAVESERRLTAKRDEIRSRLEELRLKKNRKEGPFRRLLALVCLKPLPGPCALWEGSSLTGLLGIERSDAASASRRS